MAADYRRTLECFQQHACSGCRRYSATNGPHLYVMNLCLQYSVSGGLCLQCLAGQFSAGNVSSCSSCVAGRFSGGGASSCTNCTAGSSSGGQASSCSVCGGGQVSDCVLMWHCGSSGHCVACVDWYGFNLVSLHILRSRNGGRRGGRRGRRGGRGGGVS